MPKIQAQDRLSAGLLFAKLFEISNMISEKIKYPLLFIVLSFNSFLSAQQPTHIDPGYGDESVSIFSNPLYIVLIVGLLVVVAVGFYFLRKDNQKRK
jgi:hypothetical protein